MNSPLVRNVRLQFIDFARGLVMIIMAWDHVSGFWMRLHGGLEGIYPHRNPSLDLTLFLARFITHWCAPTFVFLSGVSLALSVNKRLAQGENQGEVSLHIVKRGLLLLFFEALIVAPAFDLPFLYFGVIAAIGVSLIIFSVARRLPTTIILALSLTIILNHQFLDMSLIPNDVAWGHYLRRVINEPGFTWSPFFSLYPVIPWIGVVGLGWVFGSYLWSLNKTKLPQLKLMLAITGFVSVAFFFVVRWLNGYGNLVRRWSDNFMDWLYISKYPPSVSFLLWSLGGMSLFLALGLLLEERGYSNRNLAGAVHTFGRTPLFFYLIHLWLYRLRLPNVHNPPFYLELFPTLTFWAFGLVLLWLLCSRYEKLKRMYPRFLKFV